MKNPTKIYMQKNADGEYDTWSSDMIKRDDDVFILETKEDGN